MLDLEKLKIGDVVQDSRPEFMDKWKLIEKRKSFWLCECIQADKTQCYVKGDQRELYLGATFLQLVEQPEQPEAWEPKHGDIVWNTKQKQKHAIIELENKLYLFGRHGNGEIQWLYIIDDDRKYKYLEPYTNQDAPQWPKTWEELGTIEGYYIQSDSFIKYASGITNQNGNQNIFPTERHAKAALAFAQLSQIAARMNDGFVKDWTDGDTESYTILCHDESLYTEHCIYIRHNIYFKTEEMAEFSLKHHSQLWKDYWMMD